jgi:hypothetical protein
VATFKQRELSIRQKPTRVYLDALFIQSKGDIRDDALEKIRRVTIDAFMSASHAEGLTSTWSMEMKAKTPKDFDAILGRRRLCLPEPSTGEPQAADAVDPVAVSHPTQPPRDE